MKKLFSLLFVALLTLSAGAATYSFTFESSPKFSTDGGTYTYDDVTWTYPSSPYISYEGGATSRGVQIGSNKNPAESFTFSTSDIEGTITKITVKASSTSSDADLRVTVGNSAFGGIQSIAGTNNQDFTFEGSAEGEIVVTWTNNAIEKAMYFKSITVEYEDGDTPPTPAVAAPVFDPNGGEFRVNSLAVTVSCPTENASIYLFKVLEDETEQYVNQFFPQNGVVSGEFYVTETSKYGAYAYKGSDYSETTYVTFTKVTPQVATPTFNPASGTEFEDELDVTISCATPGATIMYEYGDVIDEGVAPVTITLTDNATITAIASLDGYEDSETATATYTKSEPAPAATYQLVTDVTTLQAGDKIALVGKKDANAYVMAEERQNNFGGAAIVLNGNEFSSNEAFVLTLEVANDTTWNLKTANDRYLYANSSSSNQLKTEATVDGNGNANAMITNGENGAASIVFKGTSTRNVMQFNYNNNNPTLFSCYASANQAPVYIYKQMSEVVMPAAPTISPASQEFTEPIEVTITNNEPGATLMYAINDGEFAEYEAPFTVTETTTVKAYAEKDGVTSEPVTATYTYVAPTVTVANLAEVHALDSATNFIYTGNIVVTFRNTSNIFVRDNANNSALIYQSGLDAGIDKGTTIAPNWGGTKTIYFNETEIINLENFTANGTQEVLPFERQSISSADYAAYVVIKNVAIDSTYVWGYRNTYVTNTGVIVRDNWQKGFSPETGKTYDIIGIVSAYQGTTVLNIVEVVGYVPEVNEVSTIAEAAELAVGEEFTYVSEAVVVYQPATDLRYTWIKDGSGYGLIYDNKRTVPAMEQGTVLKDGWSAQVDIYNGAKQFVSPQNVEASDDDPVEVNPIEMTNVAIADVHKYVIMKGQTLTATGANKTWDNADGLIFYDKFNVNPTFEEGKTYDVVGIVTTYTVSGEIVPEIFIISATEAAAQQWALGDVNHDTFVNVADVTALIQYILTSGEAPAVFYVEQANIDGDVDGTLNVADVTALIQLVLNQ